MRLQPVHSRTLGGPLVGTAAGPVISVVAERLGPRLFGLIAPAGARVAAEQALVAALRLFEADPTPTDRHSRLDLVDSSIARGVLPLHRRRHVR